MYTSELPQDIQERLSRRLTHIRKNFDSYILGYKEFGDIDYLRDAEDLVEDSKHYLKVYTCDHEIFEDDYAVQCPRCRMYVSLM